MALAIQYLSQLIGKPVFDPKGQPVGRLGDMVVRLGGPFPPVTGLTLRLGGAGPGIRSRATFLHWSQVDSVSSAGLTLSSTRLDLQQFSRRPGELLLDADLMDQQVMDLHGHKLVRVNDVQLVGGGPKGTDLRLAGVDVGVCGLLRRIDLGSLVGWFTSHTPFSVPDKVIPWDNIEPVDWSELQGDEHGEMGAGATGECRGISRGLQLTHEKLAALHPADVAELVAQLSAPERAAILESLDTETAAETLGELEPEMQADLLEALPTDSALELLAELPPDEAADALAEVEPHRASELLSRLDPDEAQAVRRLMSYPKDVAGGMMTTAYVALPADMTAQQTIEELRRLAPPVEEIYYVYVLDENGVLVGVLSLRDLIVSKPDVRLSDIIGDQAEVVHVPVNLSEDEVIRVIEKYNLLAVPVTDEASRLVGVITVDDALSAAVPEVPRGLSRMR